MFKRLFVLLLLAIATVSVSTPAHASTESLSINCEHVGGNIYCEAPGGYSSYTWTWRELPWSYTYTWTTTENYFFLRCEGNYGLMVSVSSAGESSPTMYISCGGG